MRKKTRQNRPFDHSHLPLFILLCCIKVVWEKTSNSIPHTIQSAFKYDHPFEEVQEGIKRLEQRQVSRPEQVDEGRFYEIIEKYTRRYIEELMPLSDIINQISTYIPSRRKRKLHIGLFGYSHSTGGMRLPRAITFSATLYSLGVPPEVLGL